MKGLPVTDRGFRRLALRLAPKDELKELANGREVESKFASFMFRPDNKAWEVSIPVQGRIRDDEGHIKPSKRCKRFPKHLDYRQVDGHRVYLSVPSVILIRMLPALGFRKGKSPD